MFGKDGISVSSSGSSEMNNGKMNMFFWSCLSCCHALRSGLLYPPCKTEEISVGCPGRYSALWTIVLIGKLYCFLLPEALKESRGACVDEKAGIPTNYGWG